MAIVLSAKQFGLIIVAIQLIVFGVTTVILIPSANQNQPKSELHHPFEPSELCHVNAERILLNLDDLLSAVQHLEWDYDLFVSSKQSLTARLKDMDTGIRYIIESALHVASAECLPRH